MLLIGGLPDAEPCLAVLSLDLPSDTKGVAEVGVVSLIERPHQPKSRLY
jgi:hypothetical protein